MRRYLGTSRGGKIGEKGGYNIMGDQAFRNIIKSTFTMKGGGKIIK
jgi:hypothetical protein